MWRSLHFLRVPEKDNISLYKGDSLSSSPTEKPQAPSRSKKIPETTSSSTSYISQSIPTSELLTSHHLAELTENFLHL